MLGILAFEGRLPVDGDDPIGRDPVWVGLSFRTIFAESTRSPCHSVHDRARRVE